VFAPSIHGHKWWTGEFVRENTIMPNGACNITSDDGLKVLVPIQENKHLIATAHNPNYGTHVLVTGRDNRIYHKHQIAPGDESKWSPWKCLTPDFSVVPCSSAPNCRGYDGSPAVAWQPVNGTLVVFVRQMDDLDLHEFHLENPKDPDSWSMLREPACLCNFPPCKGQTRCGATAECSNDGPDCSKTPSSLRKFWNESPPVSSYNSDRA
jgi:hypothetical protein